MEKFSLDRLAGHLSQEEKQDLLKQIASLDEEKQSGPLIIDEENFRSSSEISVSHYKDQSRFVQLMLKILSVFTGTKPDKIWLKWQLKAIYRYIVSVDPDLFDSQGAGFSKAFIEEINELRVLASELKSLGSFGESDYLGSLAFFCAQWEIPEVLARIEKSCNPSSVFNNNQAYSFKDIKNEIFLNLDTILNDISPHRLKTLESSWIRVVLIDRLVTLVSTRFYLIDNRGGNARISLDVLKELYGILTVLRRNGYNGFFKYLYLFECYNKDKLSEEGSCNGSALEYRDKSEEFLDKIRRLSKTVPLLHLIRYMSSDLGFCGSEPVSVPSWKNLIKKKLHLNIGEMYARFTYGRKIEQVRHDIKEKLGLSVDSDSDANGLFLYSLGLIRMFLSEKYRSRSYKFLSIIFYDGEFFRDENRNEFDNVFNYFNKACDRSLDLLESEDPQVNSEFVKNTAFHFESMQKILVGIFFHSSQSGYDTLMNKKNIGGTSHEILKKNLKKFTSDLEYCLKYLKILIELESL